MASSLAMSVLIVDDDPAIRDVLTELLTDEGYAAIAAPHGADALASLEQIRPCLILLDLMMPVMDGFAFRAVQRSDPQLAEIPVIVLSAFPASIEAAAELDAAAYLRKPVRLDRLLATVERYCGG
jgi:CheY-like chemotaxis protein